VRVFLDTCTVQIIYDYGAVVFEGDRSLIDERIEKYPNGTQNLAALHGMMEADSMGAPSFSFVLSESSLEEIRNRGVPGYTRYAYDVVESWQITVDEIGPEAFTGKGPEWAEQLQQDQFEYLSDEDRQLVVEALVLECDAFLTIEEKLPKQSDHLNQELPIQVYRPYEFWEDILEPHFGTCPSW
jgi:hypothetical protein